MILKIEGIPTTTIKSSEDVLKKVIEKRIQNFKYDKLIIVEKFNNLTAYIQSSDVGSVIKVLGLHL